MTLRVLIVDDERLARRALRQLLVKHADVEIVGECADAIDAAEELRQREVDLVLLDIRMPALSGLTFALGMSARPFIVFVTAHDEHAAAAFETGAADYLLKPVTARRMASMLSRVRARKAEAEAAALARPRAGRRVRERHLDRLVVRVGTRDVVVPVDEIELLAADDVHVAVHAHGRRYLMRATLDQLATRLDPGQFVRVHRSYVVPLHAVVAIRRAARGAAILELQNGAAVPVSRRRKKALRGLSADAARG
ncbi:MAG TPA: LytTR family DNA-binding domain-containing protein [Gemmatimonadaceae bacterium]|nr:LytTR family DNA-binding domain-containing protein [Gemmatimonadaceae bacterium]